VGVEDEDVHAGELTVSYRAPVAGAYDDQGSDESGSMP
jgi:hypothetical protein